ncbi:hypothetical protein HRbin15_00470 [bacterium HR15]|nr:hypothetical protein HRbin15_00470 [bacterium HR15]
MLGYGDDPLTQPVTYDQPAQAMKQVLEALSRQTGVRLFAPSPIDAEIVLVSVHEMPLKELMDHLAVVSDGEWFKQPDGSYHLVRTPKIVKERRQQDDERILQGLKRTFERKEIKSLLEPLTEQQARQHRDKIKALMREMEAQDSNTTPWDMPQYQSIREQTDALLAGKRLVMRLIQKMGLQRLLEIPVGEQHVFSNVSGRFLLPLGFSVQPLLQQYFQEHRLVYDLWTHPTEGISKEQLENFNRRYGYVIGDYWLRQAPPSQLPTRVYLAVWRQSPASFLFTVTVASEDMREFAGGDAAQGYLWASLWEEEEQASESPAPAPQSPQTPAQPVERIEWSERSRQFIEAYRAMERTTESVPLPEILDPARVEPLSLIPSDVLRTIARKKGKSIVAMLSDSAHTWGFSRAIAGRDELKPFLDEILERPYFYELYETETLLRLKPQLSSYTWGQRVQRQPLSDWMRHILQQKYLRLEDYLSLKRIVGHQHIWNGLESLYLSLLLGGQASVWWLYNADMRFLLSLTADQMARLRAGQELPLSAFTPAQREQLIRDLYFGRTRLERRVWDEDMPWAGMYSILIHCIYPNGLPSDTAISLQRSEPDLGVFTERRVGVWSGYRNLFNLAYAFHQAQSEQSASWIEEYSLRYFREQVERYRSLPLMPASRQVFIIEVRLGERYVVRLPSQWSGDLGDYELLNDGKPATIDALPKEFKERLEEYQKQLKRSPDSEEP